VPDCGRAGTAAAEDSCKILGIDEAQSVSERS